jgi:hypothetical protein
MAKNCITFSIKTEFKNVICIDENCTSCKEPIDLSGYIMIINGKKVAVLLCENCYKEFEEIRNRPKAYETVVKHKPKFGFESIKIYLN